MYKYATSIAINYDYIITNYVCTNSLSISL